MTDENVACSSKTSDDHTRWLTETWQMIERCAASLNPMECVKLTTAGCAALIQERRSDETSAAPKRAYYETHDAPHCPSCSCGMSPWRSMESAPRSGVALWLITPKAEDEAYTDTSGRPITGKFAPYVHLGPYGCWSALSKAVGWCPVPAPHMPPSKASEPTCNGLCQGAMADANCPVHGVAAWLRAEKANGDPA